MKSYPYIAHYKEFLDFYLNDDSVNKYPIHLKIKQHIKNNGSVVTKQMIDEMPSLKQHWCYCQACEDYFETIIVIGKSYDAHGDSEYWICESCLSKSYNLIKKE